MPLKVSLTDQVAGLGLDADRHESHLSPPRIVCAANRLTYIDAMGHHQVIIIAGARHCDEIMNPVRRLLLNGIQEKHSQFYGNILPGAGMDNNYLEEVQGFIDQHGAFYNREQAHEIAKRNGQLVRETGYGVKNKLYSEDLY